MANTTKAKILLIAPELINLTDPGDVTWDLILADVASDITSTIYGSYQERAQRYLAAHCLTMIYRTQKGDAANAAGGLIMEKNGEVIKQYASSGKTGTGTSHYDMTTYGKQFLALRSKCIVGFHVVVPGV